MIKHFRNGAAASGLVLLLSFASVPASALSSHAAAQAQAAVAQPAATTDGTNPGAGKLSAARLRACQNRQQAITNIMSRIADRGQKQLDLFTTIATRTENFYTSKGKTLSNYDTLVADVNAQQAAAQSEVTAIRSASTSFSCDAGNPQGMVQSFKTALKGEISALQAYRTSVKNLIVGVKSVQSTTTGSTGTEGSQQ